ncbi:MAG: Ig-like domain-containing protein [Lachnospiraceae bacterium]|nr:Ig-like domain-containing protein [Lachnospiraceae bacterium]
MSKGKTYYVQVRAYKKSGNSTLKGSWSSSKTSVAAVSKSGKVTAKSPGTAVIKAKVG